MKTQARYPIFVAGEWKQSTGKRVYPNVNPAHRGEVLGDVVECTADEVLMAVAAAEDAFPKWRAVSGNVKTKIFLHLAQILYRDYESIVRTMTREMGKSHYDARLDLDEAIGVVECVAPQGLSLKGETYQKNAEGVVMESRLEPRGVAAIITPFNFPVAIPLAQVTAALVTGNTVVWKPSHLIPESSAVIVKAISEAFVWAQERLNAAVPSGVLNMISGDSAAGDTLVRQPAVMCVSFTGSKAVGDAVDSLASGLGKRVMKEVGGINMFYVHRAADIDRAARNFVYGKTITAGQRCTSIQEVLCDGEVYQAFVDAVVREAAGIVIGEGSSVRVAEADMTVGEYSLPPVISEEQQKRVLGLVAQAVEEGADILYQTPLRDDLKSGFYVPFTLLAVHDAKNVACRTELFGPVGVLRRVSGLGEAIKRINGTVGIVACIDSKDKDVTETFIQSVLRTRVDDGRHGTGAFWATRFGGDRGAGSGNPALDENMVMGYVLWKTIYRSYQNRAESDDGVSDA